MPKSYTSLQWPSGGVHKRLSYAYQPPYTSPSALNVRTDDAIESRERGGSRPGLTKYSATQIGSGNPVRLISDVAYVSGGAYAQKVVASSNGLLFYDNAGVWTLVTAAPTLMSDRMLTAADHLQKLYIASSAAGKLCVFNPADNTLSEVVANPATSPLPTNCDLVAMWRDRIVLAGDRVDPHLWYMSKLGVPTNWDYSPATTTSADAVSATNSDAGRIGEPIRALVSHTDECMLFGCSSSLWVLRGDPQAGGRIMKLSEEVGILDRASWCYDANGYLWFLSQDGLYVMPPGCGDEPISVSREKLPSELVRVDRAAYTVSMAYDFLHRGIHLFVTKTTGSTGVGHWWIDTKVTRGGDREVIASAAFWPQSFQTTHEPTAIFARRDYTPSSTSLSPVLLGGRDGYTRQFDDSLAQDDGASAISSHVDIGPFPLGPPGYHGRLEEIQLVAARSSGNIKLTVRTGDGAEEAYHATRQEEYSLTRASLNRTLRPRARGQAALLRISGNESNTKWSLEDLNIRRQAAGVRRV